MWINISKLNNKESIDRIIIPINTFTWRSMEELEQLFTDKIPDKITKSSHIYEAQNSKLFAKVIEKFCKWKKTFKSCVISKEKENTTEICTNLAFINTIKHCFCAQKEFYQWKLSEFNRINDEDLNDVGLDIEIIKPQEKLSKKQIIVEIRNALEHHQYLTCTEGIYINNPKNENPRIHDRDFVAKITYKSLIDYICRINYLSRKMYIVSPWYGNDLDFNKSYKEQKDKIWFEVKKSTQKENDWISKKISDEKKFQEYVNNLEIHRLPLSDKQQRMLELFFEKNKLSHSNLEYVASTLQYRTVRDDIYLYILGKVLNDKPGKIAFEQIKWNKEILKTVQYLIFGRNNPIEDAIRGWENWEKSHDCSLLRNVWRMLITNKEISTSKNRRHDYLDYIITFYKKQGFIFADNYQKHWPCLIKTGLNWKIETVMPFRIISAFIDNLHTEELVVERMFKEFPNWIKMQYIKTIFIDWIADTPEEWNQKSEDDKDKFTKFEHIRNALTHNTYTKYNGIDTILLRDWYNKKTMQRGWEELFNINDLYNLPCKNKRPDWEVLE